ncbi:MAG TPA: hypothetical protein VFD04_17895 [Actinomycetes bacterium]|jgi:hypothetical protein|nr:hypothetical protein [Actinomycetes bacterium]
MTIEERVRRMLAEAVAYQPAPSGAPFEGAVRRHRRRRLRAAAAAAMALLLAAAVAVAGIRALGTRPTLLPVAPAVPAVPPGWKTFQNGVYNLRFAYPPDWVVGREGGFEVVVPRALAGPGGSKPSTAGPFAVTVGLGLDHYRFVIQNGTQVTSGRLAGGRAFIRWSEVSSGVRYTNYSIDWGRYCLGARQDCGSHSIIAAVQAADRALLDRYGPVAAGIIGTLAPLRATQASTGDPTRPACRPDQWRPVLASRSKLAFDRPRWVIAGAVQYLRGPACHLQAPLRLTVERTDGTAVAVPGTPSALTVAADLPEDGGQPGQFMRTATMWFWGWDNWCRQPLPQARVRVTADGGASATRPLPSPSIEDPHHPCQPSAPWKVAPLP